MASDCRAIAILLFRRHGLVKCPVANAAIYGDGNSVLCAWFRSVKYWPARGRAQEGKIRKKISKTLEDARVDSLYHLLSSYVAKEYAFWMNSDCRCDPDLKPACILIIDDERSARELLPRHLKELDCVIEVAINGSLGEQLLRSNEYDLVILDLMLPDIDGLELCRRMRARMDPTPLLILSAKSSEYDRVLGLEMGADDYLAKPYSAIELLARVKALLRRANKLTKTAVDLSSQRVHVGSIAIDVDKRDVKIDGRPVELTVREFDLLTQLAKHPGRVYTRSQLLDLVWGHNNVSFEHTVSCHINRLRRKIERDQSNPELILTVWGIGYKLNERQTL